MKNVSSISQFCKHSAMFATIFPSPTTVREEIGALEQLQLMLLDLILTHTACGGLQTWIPVFSRALLSSVVYNMLNSLSFSGLEAKFYGEPFSARTSFLLGRFQTQQLSLFCSSSGIVQIAVEVVSIFLSLLTQVVRRVLQDPSESVAIQAYTRANCNHSKSK